MTDERLHKISEGDWREDNPPLRYGNRYRLETGEGWARLVIGPDPIDGPGPVETMVRLLPVLTSPFWLMFVLVLSRSGQHAPGRYQSPDLVEADRIALFLERFRAFLEGDARQAVWIGSPEAGVQLVYEQHGLIYAYRALDAITAVLEQLGYEEGAVDIPFPHGHNYHASFDEAEAEVIGLTDWREYDLQEGDDPY